MRFYRIYRMATAGLISVALSAMSGTNASADSYTEGRIKQARSVYEQHVRERRELSEKEFYLLSFYPGLPSGRVLAVFDAKEIRVSAVHTCQPGGGVTAFFIDSTLPLTPQISKILEEVYEESTRAVDSRRTASPPMASAATAVRSRSGAPGFCGIEFKARSSTTESIVRSFSGSLIAVELITSRERRLPINLE